MGRVKNEGSGSDTEKQGFEKRARKRRDKWRMEEAAIVTMKES